MPPAAALPKPEQSRAFKMGVTIAIVVVALLSAVGGFFAWKHFFPSTPPPKAAPAPAPKIPKPTPVPATPPAASTSTTPKPATPTVPNPPAPEAPVKLVIDSPNSSRSSTTPLPSGVAPTPLAPGVTATVTPPMNAPDASPAFRAFVANMKIAGVFQGDPPRAYINGRTIRAGEYVDASLGIIFDSVDPEKKQIIFRDRNDVTVRRKY